MITSVFAVMEAIGVIRTRTTEANRCRSGSDDERRAIDGIVRKAVASLLDHIDDLANQGLLSVMKLDEWSPDFAAMRGKMLEHPGFTVPGPAGHICRHRGIGPPDWLHIAIARDAGAAVICTTGKALADIAGSDDEFGRNPIRLTGVGAIGPLYGLWRALQLARCSQLNTRSVFAAFGGSWASRPPQCANASAWRTWPHSAPLRAAPGRCAERARRDLAACGRRPGKCALPSVRGQGRIPWPARPPARPPARLPLQAARRMRPRGGRPPQRANSRPAQGPRDPRRH